MEDRDEQRAKEQVEEMEEQARQMEERSEEAERDIGGARSDWESKKGDESAPGAQDEEGASDTTAEELRERRGGERDEGDAADQGESQG